MESLWNKSKELQAQARYSHMFRDSCILAFTEKWLSDKDPDSDFELCVFGVPVQLDREVCWGGVYLYVNTAGANRSWFGRKLYD